jgi:epoxyqueuosine reductase
MDWIAQARTVRQDPLQRLPEARSVVVVARNYFSEQPLAPERPSGRVSRYAWGRDYHRVLDKPLKQLDLFIRDLVPSESFRSIDTGPVMEKAWAVRAGIGWLGKNGLVIREGLGSWFFLGVIVTTVALAPDTPVEDRCGTCRRCMDACPTQAIVAPSVIDTRRCIAYHTVENRGDIPIDIRKSCGDKIFGCDVCQEVCPWNRSTVASREEDFHPRPNQAWLDLREIENMSKDVFNKRFTGTSLYRAKLEGLRRNVIMVMENLGDVP